MGYFDPTTGDWVDDEMDMLPSWMYGGATNQFMPQLGIGPTMSGDYNKYGEMEPYEQGDVNQQLTGLKSMLAILKDPMFNQMVSTETGADVFPYEQMAMGGNPWGAGMGGGGGYGGAAPFVSTQLDWARGSSDPVMQTIVQQLDQNIDPFTVKQQLAASPETDQNSLDIYNEAIDTLWGEKSQAMIAAAQGGGAMNPLQQQVAKWGGMDPLAQYGADNLPADMTPDTNQYLTQQLGSADAYDLKAKKAAEDAIYEIAAPRNTAAVAEPTQLGQLSKIAERNPELARRIQADFAERQAENRAGSGGNWTDRLAMDKQWGGVFSGPEIEASLNLGGGTQAPGQRSLWRGPGLDGATMGPPSFVADQPEGALTYKTGRRGPGGGQMTTNRQGMLAEHFKRQAGMDRERAVNLDAFARNWTAQKLQQQGRTPQKDALKAQMNYLRQMGIGV